METFELHIQLFQKMYILQNYHEVAQFEHRDRTRVLTVSEISENIALYSSFQHYMRISTLYPEFRFNFEIRM